MHPFDDPLVIAGNGTIAMEILKEVRTKLLDRIHPLVLLADPCVGRRLETTLLQFLPLLAEVA